MAEVTDREEDTKELPVKSRVLDLSWGELLRKERDWGAINIALGEDGTDCGQRGVGR